MDGSDVRWDLVLLLTGIASNIGVALLGKQRRARFWLGLFGVGCVLGAGGLLLWPVVSRAILGIALYGLATLSVLFVYWDMFRRLRKAERAQKDLEDQLKQPDPQPAPKVGLERLREAWKTCQPPMNTLWAWLVGTASNPHSNLSEAEKATIELARDYVGKPLNELCHRISVGLRIDRTPSEEDFENLGKLFVLSIFKYSEAAKWLVRIDTTFDESVLLRHVLYETLYTEHMKCLDELRRISGRSDIALEIGTAVFAMSDALPTPPADPPPPTPDS